MFVINYDQTPVYITISIHLLFLLSTSHSLSITLDRSVTVEYLGFIAMSLFSYFYYYYTLEVFQTYTCWVSGEKFIQFIRLCHYVLKFFNNSPYFSLVVHSELARIITLYFFCRDALCDAFRLEECYSLYTSI